MDVAAEKDVNLLTFSGSVLKSPYAYDAQGNILYDLVGVKNVDGLIILAGALFNFSTPAEIDAFCQRFDPLPITTIARSLPGYPSVMVDNVAGMRDLMIHLIEVHKYQRLAFITGPEDDEDAKIRYQVYLDVLAKYGIPFDSDLIVKGRFRPEDGVTAVETFFDRKKVDIDVIIAVDDSTAKGALQALQARGINVPEDVALVGFDNESWTPFSIPPLTTVQQPLYEQGRYATELLLEQISHEPKGKIKTELLPSQLLTRQSCGCQSLQVAQVTHKTIPIEIKQSLSLKQPDITTALAAQEDVILSSMCKALPASFQVNGRKLTKQLFQAFINELEGQDNQFLSALKNVLYQTIHLGGTVHPWQGVISTLHNTVHYFFGEGNEPSDIRDLWHQARIMISELVQQDLTHKNWQAAQREEILNQISMELAVTFNLSHMMDVLFNGLPRLGIMRGYIALYEGGQAPTEKARLIMAFDDKGLINLPSEGIIYPSQQLLPPSILSEDKRYNLVTVPLYGRDFHLGFALFEADQLRDNVFHTLQGQLSSVLRGSQLVQEVKHHAQKLESEIAKQTINLTEANKQLQIYAEELELKNAELERSNRELEAFAYISTHDLQEPLRKIRTFSNLVETKYHKQLDERGYDYLKRIGSAAARMQNLIDALLSFSQLTSQHGPFTKVDLALVVQSVLSDLKAQTKDTSWQVECSDLPKIEALPSQMYQLFFNLIENALKFHHPDISPLVQIHSQIVFLSGTGTKGDRAYCQLTVEDNGIGFNEKYSERIFNVFQRLHTEGKYDGTGIGLAVCRKIVEQHHGFITAESSQESGSKFIVTLPLVQALDNKT